jgi:nucleotide-binding universal stress UspA family protein
MSILICYDGSPSAKHALSVANATLTGKPAILLHVWTPPDKYLADAFGISDADAGASIDGLERLGLERAREISQQGHELARELGLEVEVRVERNESDVWRTILNVAAETEAELIVVGTHGPTAIQSDLLGSVSNALAHHSKRPVLVVPASTSSA